MDTEAHGVYVFENGKLTAHPSKWNNDLIWNDFLQEHGYAEEEQVWGQYPNVYIKVYEAKPSAHTEFPFVAIVNLVRFPHRILLRDLNGLIQFVTLLTPLFAHHHRPDQDTGDALFGTQDVG